MRRTACHLVVGLASLTSVACRSRLPVDRFDVVAATRPFDPFSKTVSALGKSQPLMRNRPLPEAMELMRQQWPTVPAALRSLVPVGQDAKDVLVIALHAVRDPDSGEVMLFLRLEHIPSSGSLAWLGYALRDGKTFEMSAARSGVFAGQ